MRKLTSLLSLNVALNAIRRTVLRTGANEIIVRDRVSVPLLNAADAPPSDPLCDNDEVAINLLRGSSKLPHCPRDLWFELDLDGDGRHGHLATWKNYNRFTLRVSWPASVSPSTIYVLAERLEGSKKVSCGGDAQIASSHHIVCSYPFILHAHEHRGAAATPYSTDSSQAGGYPCSRHLAEGGGSAVSHVP